ncbi:MAG TPA: hypothetical protein VMA75_02310 [Candidatus Paceibacterota bacterium]|nr:hypothetical protein [Candidatus Paceibacterota bacterium]
MEKKIDKIEGFDGKALHPALDIKDSVLVIGFRYRAISGKIEDLILVVRNGSIEHFTDSGFSFLEDEKTYFVEKAHRLLVEISERWSLDDLNRFREEYQNPTLNGVPEGNALYGEIRNVLKRYVELEQEIDYSLITAWIIGTYFFPAFSAYPFLNAKAPKRSGKSQFLDLLTQLCFNATKARPTLAALGDTVESSRGTFLIDQADSLGGQNNEELLEHLTGSYKKNGSKRKLISLDKGKRNQLEFETYCPKVFASIKELPEDLRDRCLIVPLIRSGKNFSDPNDDNPLWLALRSKLYRFLFGNYADVANEYFLRRAMYKQSNEITGRHLELWLPFETLLRQCHVGEEEISAGKNRFISQYKFTESELGELDEAIIGVVLKKLDNEEKITLSPKEILEDLDNEQFSDSKTDRQKAGLVGAAIRRMNLSSERKRTKKGITYLFEKKKVERVYAAYFPTSPTPDVVTLENTDEKGGVSISVEL